MNPIQELRQCLQDAQNNRLHDDPSETDLKWTGFIEGLKHAIHRLEMATPKNPQFFSEMQRHHIQHPDLSVQTPFGKINIITPDNWLSNRIALLTGPQLQELCRQTECALLGTEQPLSEHARKAKDADTPHWITTTKA